MVDKICPNCFKYDFEDECLNCGYKKKDNVKRALKVGTILKDRYIVGVTIGNGGFGIVYKAFDIGTDTICVIKEFMPEKEAIRSEDGMRIEKNPDSQKLFEAERQNFNREQAILNRLSNIKSIVHMTDFFEENSTAYIVMEYLEGKDLKEYMRTYTNADRVRVVNKLMYSICEIICLMHEDFKILHRDISPDNIYITKDKQIKIIDFGCAREISNRKDEIITAKFNYSPIEQIKNDMQGPYTDVYALGSTYYYLLTGSNIPSALDREKDAKYIPLKDLGLGITIQISDFIDKSLDMDYRKRPCSVRELLKLFDQRKIKIDVESISVSCKKWLLKESEVVSKALPIHNKVNLGNKKKIIKKPYLEFTKGSMKGMSFPLGKTYASIGRSSTNTIYVQKYREVSKLHCYIGYDDSKQVFLVKDVSRNGLSLGSKKLEKNILYSIEAVKCINKEFRFANTECKFILKLIDEYI